MTTITVETYTEQEQYYHDLAEAKRAANALPAGIVDIPLSRVVEIENYRSEYPVDHILGLVENMAESGYDRAFPIKVIALDCGMFGLVAGHCRTLAYRAVMGYDRKTRESLGTIPAVIETNDDPAAIALAQLRENENRRDPGDIDRANGYKRAMDKGATLAQLCKATGKNRDYVERRLALLTLLPDVQELVAKQQIGITFALAMKGLDSNFQRIALRAYRDMKSPTFEEFSGLCSDLMEKQNTLSLFDLSLFNGIPTEILLSDLKFERKKSRAELEAELEAERKARAADREYAKSRFAILKAERDQLLAQLELKKAS